MNLERTPLYLSGADVDATLPRLEDQLSIVEGTFRRVSEGPDGQSSTAEVHAAAGRFRVTPVYVPGVDPGGTEDILGVDWRLDSGRSAGLEADCSLIVVNDPLTGEVVAVLNSTPLVAAAKAALAGWIMKVFTPDRPDYPIRAALLGLGRATTRVASAIGQLYPGAEVWICDTDTIRASKLAGEVRSLTGIRSAAASPKLGDCLTGANVVIASLAGDSNLKHPLTASDLPVPALVLSFGTPPALAPNTADGGYLVVDDRASFAAARASGALEGFPEPAMTLAQVATGQRPVRRDLVVCVQLGTEILTVALAREVAKAAREAKIGTRLD